MVLNYLFFNPSIYFFSTLAVLPNDIPVSNSSIITKSALLNIRSKSIGRYGDSNKLS